MNNKRSKRPSRETGPASTPGYGEMPHPISSEEQERDHSPSMGAEFRQTAESAGNAIREQASTLASEIGQELTRSAEDQKRRGLEAVRSFAGAVDTAARELEGQSPQVARYVRDAAESLQSLTRNIEGRNLNDLVRSASDLARSNPTLFMVGAVAAGFAIARFVKSSAQTGDISSSEGYGSASGYSDTELAIEETEIAYGNP
jgi:gas vesicle protein